MVETKDEEPGGEDFEKAKDKARDLLKDDAALERLTDAADNKVTARASAKLSGVIDDLKAFIRLLRAYAKDDYREIGFDSMVLIVAAVIYFVSPLDLLPDPIPVVGYVDDVAVIGLVLRLVKDELSSFKAWEASQPKT